MRSVRAGIGAEAPSVTVGATPRWRANTAWALLAGAALLGTAIARHPLSGIGVETPTRKEIANGAALAADGILVGDSHAPVRIVAFVDFECRFCQEFQPVLTAFRNRNAVTVAIVYRNFPLSQVGYAVPAAIAGECAAQQGRFESFADLVFSSPGALARLSLEAIAVRAGVGDITRFNVCRSDPRTAARVRRDVGIGRVAGVRSTPTIVIGNRMISGVVPADTLASLVRSLLTVRRTEVRE